jgi:thiamine transport system substrate-binding protein
MRYTVLFATSLTLVATSCSAIGGDDGDDDSGAGSGADEVVLVTHDSFSLPDALVKDFEKESGHRLEVRQVGDGGTLTNELVLTKGSPMGDVAFGIDNTFASRALEEGVFAPYEFDAPPGVEDYTLQGDDEHALTPVDNANVCVNVDDTWFAKEGIDPPEDLDDLTDPTYRDLFVTSGAATSTPGLAFLLTTIAEYGDDWPDYWEDLVANGTKITKGWEDAYNVDFTQGGGNGRRPIVLSYDSSPAFTVVDGESTTSALLDTCFEQVEYAGLIDGAENPDGGKLLIEFLVSPEVQAALPESMYVFPVVEGIELPPEWARFAEQPTDPYELDPAEVAANRETWLREWSDVTSR